MALLKFKRGAFSLQTPVKILFFKYNFDYFNPTITYISFNHYLFLTFCQLRLKLSVTELAGSYYPSKFTTAKEFAARVQLLMSKEFGLPIVDHGKDEKDVAEAELTPLGYET